MRGQVDLGFGEGMPEPQPVGMERLAIDQGSLGLARGECAPALGADHVTQGDLIPFGIHLVGQDRMANVREVDADLVRTARLRLAPDQREIAESLEDFVVS
jgi:hypothetical protein